MKHAGISLFTRPGRAASAPTKDLKTRFDEAMLARYRRIRQVCPATGSIFVRMLNAHGALAMAETLIRGTYHSQFPLDGSGHVSECFTRLWLLGHVDLSVEQLVLQEPWRQLFTGQQLEIAERRLTDCGYDCSKLNQGLLIFREAA